MDLSKNGKLFRDLRKSKGLTQQQLASSVGVLPKTVSKWETGRGFPDVSSVSLLADALGVSERILLSGDITQNQKDVGNMKRTKFYVCEHCGNIIQSAGNSQISCCGKTLEPLKPQLADENHHLTITNVEDDFYIEIDHEMTKKHYISFVSYVAMDRVLTIKLYPEQNASVRFARMFGGKLYYYCSDHGLFEYKR